MSGKSKLVEAMLKGAKQSDVVTQSLARQKKAASQLGSFEEYVDSFKEVEDLPIGEEIGEQAAFNLQKTRQEKLFNPDSDFSTFYQTQDPAEFRQRMFKQFMNPKYASKASTLNEVDTLSKDIENRFFTDERFQTTVGDKIFKEPRLLNRARAWMGDSPYTNGLDSDRPYIFVHVDRQSNPLMDGPEDVIQFKRPWEMGMHSGTNSTAIHASIRDVDDSLAIMDAFDAWVDELSGFTDNPKQTRGLIVDTIDRFFRTKFNTVGNKETSDAIFGQLRGEIESAFEQDKDLLPKIQLQLNKFFARMKGLPTASSTPHIFRGKNGLYLRDEGNFNPHTVGKQLLEVFPEDFEELQSILSGGEGPTKALQKFIESKGFDHIVYHNSVEDKGSLSIINWNPDLFGSLYDPKIAGNSAGAIAAAFWMAQMGVGDDNADVQ